MRLIPNWRQAWRFWSMRAAGAKAILVTTYLSLPDKLQDAFPPRYALAMAVIITVFGVIGGRLVDQNPQPGENGHDA